MPYCAAPGWMVRMIMVYRFQGQDSSPEEDDGGQEDGGTEEVGAAVVAGCNGPPVLLSGKEILDFVTLAIQPLAVMDWFLATVMGRDARRDALLGQHLTDFVAVLTLIPHHRCHRRQVLAQHISTGEVTALPLTQVESQGTTLQCHRAYGACWSCPLGATNQAGGTPLVEAGRRGMDFDVSGVNHQDLWLCSIGWLWASDADNSEKISSKTPLSHQHRNRL